MQESQTAQSNTGLIYGLNDRPPVREAIFAAIQPVSYTHLRARHTAFACYFCGHHYSASYHRWSIKTGFGNDQFPSIHVSLCLRYFYLYPM